MKLRVNFLLILFLNLIFCLFILLNLFKNLYFIKKNESMLKARIIAYENLNQIYLLRKLKGYSINYDDLPWVYVITPTHKTETQMPDLIRLRNTLIVIPKLIWIIIEDSPIKTNKISKFLNESNMNFIHLHISSPKIKKPEGFSLHKGVIQRNHGITWLRSNTNTLYKNSVVYFADDDNTYDRLLFEEIRFTQKVAVLAVGIVGGALYEKPICKDGKVIDWFWIYNRKRKFPLDMAGFSVNLNLLIDKKDVYFSLLTKGYLEGAFLERLATLDELEGKANDCTKVLVWHTKTKSENFDNKFINSSLYNTYIKNQIV